MKRVRTRRVATLASALICAFGAVIVGASCRSVVGLNDEYEDSINGLCALIDRCPVGITDCDSYIRPKIEGQEGEPWVPWMQHLGDRQCFEGCKSARGCLDFPPVCTTGACGKKEECCGFATGRATCDVDGGKCCRPAGVSCASDEDCCEGAGPCSPVSRTCGGVTCKNKDDPCANDFECCSKVCLDAKCSETTCSDAGYECARDEECCEGLFCQEATDSPLGGRCVKPSMCSLAGFPCADDNECCTVNGVTLVCYRPEGESVGFCSTCKGGLPDGTDCGADAQCCSGHCDENFFLCGKLCVDEGGACATDAECCDGACVNGVCDVQCPSTCSTDADCCPDGCVGPQCGPLCVGGLCKPACAVPQTCLHDVCSAGAPLKGDCTSCDSPGCTIDKACVQSICDLDPYCCCTSWDSLCIAHVFELAKTCPNGCSG